MKPNFLRNALGTLLLVLALPAAHAQGASAPPTDAETGLAIAPGFPLVKAYCTLCHSAKLVTQSGKTRDGWVETIRWMQRTQGLFDLGSFEGEILDYLAAQYGIKAQTGSMLKLPPLAAELMPPLPSAAAAR
ncbi:MAG: hypothetical protein AzoDbin1_02393 [Azoarcus sp.]|uniref:Sulfite dehydrogenase (Cytochrome) subunit SorB n=1 Tax=Aromatoleum tolulyticum TaxID=34027 RepID=A0A1N7CJP8_9RHOO|nr:hypothetical protein [Aromatoleum tolulyticum]MCK9985921.1 hypothetical protein [Azoarcus sp.]SIR63819.1 sulfite dehydrogenase (cytochrome) subunit SorB [Aromatoleum tolulyticum]